MKAVLVDRDRDWREPSMAVARSLGYDMEQESDYPGACPWEWNVPPVFVARDFSVVPGHYRRGFWPGPVPAQREPKYWTIPGTYIFATRKPARTVSELPSDTMKLLGTALDMLRLMDKPYNICLDHGESAGQKLPWAHFWIIDREQWWWDTRMSLADFMAVKM
jgi:hypothetical protein